MSFEHIIADCEHPFEEMKKLAALKKLELSKLDFELVDTSLYMRFSPSEPYAIANSDTIRKLKNDTDFAFNPSLELKETYAIKVFLAPAQKKVDMDVTLTTNKTLSKVEALIRKESKIQITETLLKDIYSELIKLKLRHGLLLTLYKEELLANTKELCAHIKKIGGLKEDYKIILCSFFESEPTINAELIHRYKEKTGIKNEYQRVDYSMREYATGVKSGDVVFTYMKPKKGTDGRDCKGRVVTPQEPTVIDISSFVTDDTMESVDKLDRVDSVAKKGGCVLQEGGKYTIKDSFDFGNVSFKQTGHLIFDIESGVKVKVTNSDPLQDAVGENMKLILGELEVNGNIGNAVDIKAKKVTINGQTHTNSVIDADDVYVAVHKGKIKAKRAVVKKLEGGIIQADEIEIEESLSGTIYGKNIKIKTMHSHSTIYATSTIELFHIVGGENKLCIDMEALPEQKKLIEEAREHKVRYEEFIKKASDEYHKKSEFIKASMNSINELKKKISEIKAAGQTPPPVLSNKLREFLVLIKHIDELKRELEEKIAALKDAKEKIGEFDKMIYLAKIVAVQKWLGYNEVKFKTLEPRNEFIYIPKGKEKEISLVIDEKDGRNRLEIKY